SSTRQKACSACTKAKRRCDLRHPACRRCVVKGIECFYSSTRLHDRSSNQSQALGADQTAVSLRRPVDDVFLDSVNFALPSPMASVTSSYSDPYDAIASPNQFFLSPQSWLVVKFTRAAPREDYRVPDMQHSIQQILRWLKEWVRDGSTMFIHKQLYQDHLPKCIQDAYMACATYFSSTDNNRGMVMRILEERVSMLLDEQAAQAELFELPHLEDGSSSSNTSGIPVFGVSEHLARVQALLVYQVLRLFSPDDQQREKAEDVIPTLKLWSMQMLECALLSSEYVRSAPKQLTSIHEAPFEKKRQSEWQAWILAESVRRTWLVAGHAQCIYSLLQYGISLCPGGLMFTTRAGLWEAESAAEWWERSRQKDVLFLQSLETEKHLLEHNKPEEIDDFGQFIVKIIAKRKNVESWLS
ncbi:hypothetical protein BGW36DRAFT_273895, partial [Talaromyces proteolyticus]